MSPTLRDRKALKASIRIFAAILVALVPNAAMSVSNIQELEQRGMLNYGRTMVAGHYAGMFQLCSSGKFITIVVPHHLKNLSSIVCPSGPPPIYGPTAMAPLTDVISPWRTLSGPAGGHHATGDGDLAARGHGLVVQNGDPLQLLWVADGRVAVGRFFRIHSYTSERLVFVTCRDEITNLVEYPKVRILHLTLCPQGKDYGNLISRLKKVKPDYVAPIPG